MEIIWSKHASFMDARAFHEITVGYEEIYIDVGTGDGRFVRHKAQAHPDSFIIGIDACRENLHEVSRRAPANTLFVIANALELPSELYGAATEVTINFPWGSLVDGLLADDAGLLAGLAMMSRPNARLGVRLNGGALAEADWSLENGARRVREVLTWNRFHVQEPELLAASELKAFPTTWAKRLAFGRDPRAMCLRAVRRADMVYPDVIEAMVANG
jgi:hypothetical protein